jgi:hypothetical protein
VSKLACIEMIELVKKLMVEYSEEFDERIENKEPFVIVSATYETEGHLKVSLEEILKLKLIRKRGQIERRTSQ